MNPFVVTVLLATAQPGVGELYRAGVDSITECNSFDNPKGIFGPNGFNQKILMLRCDRLKPFMICKTHNRLDCIPEDVANNDEHIWTVRYHKLPAPSFNYALDGIIQDGTP